jgi:hypothetical protein
MTLLAAHSKGTEYEAFEFAVKARLNASSGGSWRYRRGFGKQRLFSKIVLTSSEWTGLSKKYLPSFYLIFLLHP